ncbi:uncharacterized protein F5147DRAFT_656320 [Suillus discolor]|uniref:Uncharacterized protein n=1 Tax=Suillus discolor TaxID=1912936 RepID=A0A9P7EY84_9AGAM|nr:uncharacterized protein F5147DRAFT_656320 [Suillus discolor]KAG2097511.1 hypothetical protein F5147DRAFT_656320 [Suillus discolor]
MVYFISMVRQKNWLHFNGQALNMGGKSTHRGGKLIVGRISFVTPVALNVEKFYGRACVPTVYYPRREITNSHQGMISTCVPIHDVNNAGHGGKKAPHNQVAIHVEQPLVIDF